MFETVLFPVDQRNNALEMANAVITFSEKQASRLFLLSVVGVTDDLEERTPESRRSLLHQTRARVEAVGVPCEVVDRQVRSAVEICSLATELNVDVIVVGLKGVSPDQDTDSTAFNVIQHAPCPVLVVP